MRSDAGIALQGLITQVYFEGVCLNPRHPGPRRVLGRCRAAVRGPFCRDPLDPGIESRRPVLNSAKRAFGATLLHLCSLLLSQSRPRLDTEEISCAHKRNVEDRVSENNNRVCKSRNVENRISENSTRDCKYGIARGNDGRPWRLRNPRSLILEDFKPAEAMTVDTSGLKN